MNRNTAKNRAITAILVLFALSLPSCSRSSKENAVGTVNDRPILVKDFKKEIALVSRGDPSIMGNPKALEEQLGRIIDRRLMIQEAAQRGMTQDERFVETIKIFWEQTLIRQLMDAKTREWSDRLVVTDAEVRSYYGRMNYRVTFRLAKTLTLESADEAARLMAAGAGGATLKGAPAGGAGIYEVIGPVLLEDMPGTLNPVFDLSPGEIRHFRDQDGYSVVQVIKKEKAAAPSFEEASGRIKKAIFERKKEEAMQEWIRDMRKKARIKVDLGALSRIYDEK